MRNLLPQRWRRLWLVPLLGLVPVVVAVVLASEGRFGAPGGTPVASAPAATSTTVTTALAATPVPNQAPAVQAQPAQSGAADTPALAQATASQSTGTQSSAAQSAGTQATAPQAARVGQASTVSGAITAPAAGNATTASSGTGLFRAYRVQPGDTVRFVAQMFGVSPASVAQASGLHNPDQLRVGQLLTVPSQPGWLYRVQPGETLDQIAARTGVASAIIRSASNLTIDAVRPGDVILIPDQLAARGK
jgi:LysM repeat protein